mgnify:CR=1 FL=1
MAGGDCTLPGNATVLMPGEGYEGVTKFVLDRITTYGLNACPPLLVGVGVGTSVETAALNSKKALMRPIGSHNDNANAAKMEKLLEDGINAIGLGPQGMGIRQVFDSKLSQVPNMCEDTNLYISMMRQKAAIEVNEDGAKASAVTVAGMDSSEGMLFSY